MKTQSTPDETPARGTNHIEAARAAGADHIAPTSARRWRRRVFQTYLVAATFAFGILAVLAGMRIYFPIDLNVTRAVQTVNVAWFASLMWWVSFIGYAPQIVLLVAAIAISLFVIGLRWEAVTALGAAIGSTCLDQLIKIAVHRPRPAANMVHVLQQLNSYSFPSGHVLTYTAFFGFLFFLGYTLLKPSFARTVLLAISGSLVALVGLSRIYVGDHWASDVIGAYLLGSLWLASSVYIYRWGKTRFFTRQPMAPEESENQVKHHEWTDSTNNKP